MLMLSLFGCAQVALSKKNDPFEVKLKRERKKGALVFNHIHDSVNHNNSESKKRQSQQQAVRDAELGNGNVGSIDDFVPDGDDFESFLADMNSEDSMDEEEVVLTERQKLKAKRLRQQPEPKSALGKMAQRAAQQAAGAAQRAHKVIATGRHVLAGTTPSNNQSDEVDLETGQQSEDMWHLPRRTTKG